MFKQPNEQFDSRPPLLEMTYNGEVPNIDGFRIINVSGREFLLDEIDQSSVPNRDGVIIKGQQLPPRVLTIQYELISESEEQARQQFNDLNRFFRTKSDVPVTFSDEDDKIYYGRFQSSESVPMGLSAFISTFQILCSDPYKYETPREIGNDVDIDLYYPIRPNHIQVSLSSNTNSLLIRNETSGQRIVLNGDYSSGDTITVDFDKREIRLNGNPITSHLDYTVSDFMNFRIFTGDVLSTNPSASLGMTVRRKWL